MYFFIFASCEPLSLHEKFGGLKFEKKRAGTKLIPFTAVYNQIIDFKNGNLLYGAWLKFTTKLIFNSLPPKLILVERSKI